MTDAAVDALLPSPAEVRCALSLDLRLVVHGLIALSGHTDDQTRALMHEIQRIKVAALARKLTGLVPPEGLTRAAHGDEVDIFDLIDHLPFVRHVWLMEAANAAAEIEQVLSRLDELPGLDSNQQPFG